MKSLTQKTSDIFLINNKTASAETYDSFLKQLLPEKIGLTSEDNSDGTQAQFYKLKDKDGNVFVVIEHFKNDHTQYSISKSKQK